MAKRYVVADLPLNTTLISSYYDVNSNHKAICSGLAAICNAIFQRGSESLLYIKS